MEHVRLVGIVKSHRVQQLPGAVAETDLGRIVVFLAVADKRHRARKVQALVHRLQCDLHHLARAGRIEHVAHVGQAAEQDLVAGGTLARLGQRLGAAFRRTRQRRDGQVVGGHHLGLLDGVQQAGRLHAQHAGIALGQLAYRGGAGGVVMPQRFGAQRGHGRQAGDPVGLRHFRARFRRRQLAHAVDQRGRQAPVHGGGVPHFLQAQSQQCRRRILDRASGLVGLALQLMPALRHIKGQHHAAQRVQHRAHHGFFAVAAFRRVGDLLGDDPGQHGLFHFDVGDVGVARRRRQFLDQLQAQRQVADGFRAQHQHRLADGVDVLAEGRIHAAVGQPQDFLGQHRVGQHGAGHVEFLLVLAAHGAQDGGDGLGEARHVAAPPRAFPQVGQRGVALGGAGFEADRHWATWRSSGGTTLTWMLSLSAASATLAAIGLPVR